MGFLSGVLGAVKDDNNVKHYVKNIEPNLNDVIIKLHDSVGKGASAFGPALVEVGRWLHYYDEHIRNRTTYISNTLESLSTLFNDTKIAWSEEKNKSLDQQFNQWAERARQYTDKVNQADDARIKLDKELTNKLATPLKVIRQAVNCFKQSCENRDLMFLKGKAASELQTLKGNVESKLSEEISAMKKKLEMNFKANIQNPIKVINRGLTDIQIDLYDWGEKVDTVIKAAIHRCDDILSRVDKQTGGYENTGLIHKCAAEMKKRATALRDAAIASRDFVHDQVEVTLRDVKEMDEYLRWDLDGLKTAIQSGISDYMKRYVSEIQRQIRVIINGDSSQSGLQQLMDDVNTYVAKFQDSDTFDSGILDEWIDSIMKHNDVKRKLDWYVSDNKSKSQLLNTKLTNMVNGTDKTLWDAIKTAIKSACQAEIYSQHRVSFPGKANGEIVAHLRKVSEFCNSFAMQLHDNIHSTNIVGAVEQQVGVTSTARPLGYTYYDLAEALRILLEQLVKKARNAAVELNLLIRDGPKVSNIGNVDKALNIANPLDVAMTRALLTAREATTSAYTPLPSGIQMPNLNDNIELTITGRLNEDIGASRGMPGEAAKVDINISYFRNYNKHINQSGLTAALKYGKLKGVLSEGTLPDKIGNIERESLRRLNGNDVKVLLNKTDQTFGNMYTTITQELEHISKLITKTDGSLFNDGKRGVKVLLRELGTMLVDDTAGGLYGLTCGLKEIHRRIGHILNGKQNSSNMETLIASAEHFHTNVIREAADQAILQIDRYIEQQILEATRTIEKEAQRLYANRKQEEMQSLKMIVEDQRYQINESIINDKQNGLKGWFGHIKSGLGGIRSLPSLLTVTDLVSKVKDFLEIPLLYIQEQVNDPTNQPPTAPTKSPPTSPSPTDPAEQLAKIKKDFDKLLTHLKNNDSKKYNYDNKFVDLLSTLKDATNDLSPSHFANPRHPELLDAVKKGLEGFVGEMERVYVNGYDGGEGIKDEIFVHAVSQNLTDDGRNCAKILLTVLEIMTTNFKGLMSDCEAHKGKQINTYEDNKFGGCLKKRGYEVNFEKGKQRGELQDKPSMGGSHVLGKIQESIKGANSISVLQTWKNDQKSKNSKRHPNDDIRLFDILDFLQGHLVTYYYVSHLRHNGSAKQPCNVYEMLQWTLGLWYNPIRDPLRRYFRELFPTPDKYKEKPRDKIPTDDLNLDATIQIRAQDLASRILPNVCFNARDMLIALLGHGHAGGRYAVDFYTNSDNLLYPSKDAVCFDMLADILSRLYHQMYFLYRQCQNGRNSGGWADCYYGRHVGGSAWTCNEQQCGNQSCPQKAKQTDDQAGNQNADQGATQNEKQTAEQRCDQHPVCGVKSPLQSFLEDGLQGFLPHYLTKVGCGVKCSVTNHFGKPCLTPMGFTEIGITASHTKDGKYLKEALEDFCGRRSSLRIISSMLNCLLQRPPQTLGDMFAFLHRFLTNWNNDEKEHRKQAFELAVKEANFSDAATALDVVSIQNSKTHTTHAPGDIPKLTGDLFSLISCAAKSLPGMPCGPYLESISNDIRVIYYKKHANTYLSWVVYITETFYDLLKKLYDDCCKNCNKPGTRCYDKCCINDCQVRFSYGYKKPAEYVELKGFTSIKHESSCGSIVECRSTHAIIYSAGFTFGNPDTMRRGAARATKRTCEDFCTALKNVVKEGNLLYTLVHKHIPNFLWNIRSKFFWTTVALWLLSLFYLICVMVGRLDVLHIRSHLRIPSSHKITAQSLLAAAQVGRLAKISYLQP